MVCLIERIYMARIEVHFRNGKSAKLSKAIAAAAEADVHYIEEQRNALTIARNNAKHIGVLFELLASKGIVSAEDLGGLGFQFHACELRAVEDEVI